MNDLKCSPGSIWVYEGMEFPCHKQEEVNVTPIWMMILLGLFGGD